MKKYFINPERGFANEYTLAVAADSATAAAAAMAPGPCNPTPIYI